MYLYLSVVTNVPLALTITALLSVIITLDFCIGSIILDDVDPRYQVDECNKRIPMIANKAQNPVVTNADHS